MRQRNSNATARSNRLGRYYVRKPAATAQQRHGSTTATRRGDLAADDRGSAGPGQGGIMTALQLHEGYTARGPQAGGATTPAQPSARAAARWQGVQILMEAQGAQVWMEELLAGIDTVLQPSDEEEKQERTKGVQAQGKAKGKGHEVMELKLEIEDSLSDEEDERPPALIAAEGGSNNEPRAEVTMIKDKPTGYRVMAAPGNSIQESMVWMGESVEYEARDNGRVERLKTPIDQMDGGDNYRGGPRLG